MKIENARLNKSIGLSIGLSFAFVAGFSAVSVAGTIDLNDRESKDIIGNCTTYSSDSAACNFPSDSGYYNNLKSITMKSGDATDLTFCSFVQYNISMGFREIISVDGKKWVRGECQDFLLTSQTPTHMNPYRGADTLYRFGIKPRSMNVQTVIQVNNEKN
jgi:hypothetical protein